MLLAAPSKSGSSVTCYQALSFSPFLLELDSKFFSPQTKNWRKAAVTNFIWKIEQEEWERNSLGRASLGHMKEEKAREKYTLEDSQGSQLFLISVSFYVAQISRKPRKTSTYGSWEAVLGSHTSSWQSGLGCPLKNLSFHEKSACRILGLFCACVSGMLY